MQAKGGKKLPPIHPGKILLEDMKDEEIGINGLAQAIRVPANRISLIVNGFPFCSSGALLHVSGSTTRVGSSSSSQI
jgi:hypothetical protein